MPKPTQPRKGQFHGPWSLLLFVGFVASGTAMVYVIRYGARFIAWLFS